MLVGHLSLFAGDCVVLGMGSLLAVTAGLLPPRRTNIVAGKTAPGIVLRMRRLP